MKMKRFAALAAVTMLGVQLVGTVPAFAAEADSKCDFGGDSLNVILGVSGSGDITEDAELWIDADGILHCVEGDPANGSTDDVTRPVDSIDTLTVEMKSSKADGELTIYLDDDNNDAAEWPEFKKFDIKVTTPLIIDGSNVGTGAANDLDITFSKSDFEFSGTSGSYSAKSLDITGGDEDDMIDASKATVRVTADGGSGDDRIEGGSNNDNLDGEGCDKYDVVYGNGGNDDITSDCGTSSQGWGGDGNDDITAGIAAPGAGNDDVCAERTVTYGDLTEGMTWIEGPLGLTTGGSAGDDDISDSCLAAGASLRLVTTAGDDTVLQFSALVKVYVNGGKGNDYLKCVKCGAVYGGQGNDTLVAGGSSASDHLYGGTGDDVLKGRIGADYLYGGAGNDQAWGGVGTDVCVAEVTNMCELTRVA